MTFKNCTMMGYVLAASLAATHPTFAQQSGTSEPQVTMPTEPAPADAEPKTDASDAASNSQSSTSTETTGSAAEAVTSLSPRIADVQIVGPWKKGNQQGVWRGVMVQSNANASQYHFFVQQLTGADNDLTVTATTEIKEISTIDGSVVGYHPDDESDDEGADNDTLTLFFDVLPTGGDMAETYELHISPNEPYQFGPASN